MLSIFINLFIPSSYFVSSTSLKTKIKNKLKGFFIYKNILLAHQNYYLYINIYKYFFYKQDNNKI